jgi:hypothetical protein
MPDAGVGCCFCTSASTAACTASIDPLSPPPASMKEMLDEETGTGTFFSDFNTSAHTAHSAQDRAHTASQCTAHTAALLSAACGVVVTIDVGVERGDGGAHDFVLIIGALDQSRAGGRHCHSGGLRGGGTVKVAGRRVDAPCRAARD